MSTVIPLFGAANDEPKPPEDLVQPIAIVHGLYSLFVSRIITQEAFFLGIHAIQPMMKAGTRQSCITGV